AVQNEECGSPHLHHRLHIADKGLADSCVATCGGPSAPEQRADGRTGHRGRQDQAGEETRSSAGQDVGKAWERLAVERKSAIGTAHAYRNIPKQEVPSGPTGAPPQLDNLIAALVGPRHVVVPDGPQMRGARHGWSSFWV